MCDEDPRTMDARERVELPEWLELMPDLVRRLLMNGHRPEDVEHAFREQFSRYLTAMVETYIRIQAGEQREAWVRGDAGSTDPPWLEDPCELKASLTAIEEDLAAIREQLAGLETEPAPKRPGPRRRSPRRSPK